MKNLSLFLFVFFSLTTFTFAQDLKEFSLLDLSKLQLGKDNATVKQLQSTLNTIGYDLLLEGPGSPGNETTKFDKNLTDMIKYFQSENDLPVTGKMDLQTVTTLNKLIVYMNKNALDLEEDTNIPATSVDIAEVYNTDVSDVYGGDKDFMEGVKESSLQYVGSALKEYAGIDITGVAGKYFSVSTSKTVENENHGKFTESNLGSEVYAPVPTKSLTGNIYQDAMLKTIMGDAGTLFLRSFSNIVMPGLTSLEGNSSNNNLEVSPKVEEQVTFTKEEIDNSIKNVTGADGKFDPFACLTDPVCSKL